MRYLPERKSESRERLIRASSAVAKEQGFAGTGIDAFARAAGLTSGAFYKQFAGKSELLGAIVASELDVTRARFAMIEAGDDAQLLAAIDMYLSLGHVRHPEAGCVLPTLAPEVARATKEERAAYEEALGELQAVLAEKVGDAAVASALVSLCAGAIMIARGLVSEAARRAALEAARSGARTLLRAKRER